MGPEPESSGKLDIQEELLKHAEYASMGPEPESSGKLPGRM